MGHYHHLSINEREKILVLYTEKKSLCLTAAKSFPITRVTESLNLPFYLRDPHAPAPWQRGTNENTNGLLREYLPKFFDIALSSEEDIAVFIQKLNHRPRKCLAWKTPYEVFFNQALHLT